MDVRRYSKAIVAAAGALIVVVTDGFLDTSDVITIVVAVLAACGVYVAPNQDAGDRPRR